jgi:hypothetical protein
MASNRLFGALILANLIFIVTLSLFNSVIGKWGFFLYLPGLLFIPHYQLLGLNRSLPALFLSGLSFDLFFNHTLGFHAFAMCLIFLIAREFLHLGKQSSIQITIFQLIANLIMAILWAILCTSFQPSLASWTWTRFLIELPLSMVFLIPLSLWFSSFCNSLIMGIKPTSEGLPLLKK